jgi:hypothetical protein
MEAAYDLALELDEALLKEQVSSVVQFIRAEIERSIDPGTWLQTPYRDADAERDAQLNLEFQRDLTVWKSLPWWKRLTTRKPQAPKGI